MNLKTKYILNNPKSLNLSNYMFNDNALLRVKTVFILFFNA